MGSAVHGWGATVTEIPDGDARAGWLAHTGGGWWPLGLAGDDGRGNRWGATVRPPPRARAPGGYVREGKTNFEVQAQFEEQRRLTPGCGPPAHSPGRVSTGGTTTQVLPPPVFRGRVYLHGDTLHSRRTCDGEAPYRRTNRYPPRQCRSLTRQMGDGAGGGVRSDEGAMTVTVDGVPYTQSRSHRAGGVPAILDTLTARNRSPLRCRCGRRTGRRSPTSSPRPANVQPEPWEATPAPWRAARAVPPACCIRSKGRGSFRVRMSRCDHPRPHRRRVTAPPRPPHRRASRSCGDGW